MAAALFVATTWAGAQALAENTLRISLSAGRAHTLSMPDPITEVAVANPDTAEVVVISERDLVIIGKANGETGTVVWEGDRPRLHYRVSVLPASGGRMVLLAVRLAEVRRDLLRNIGVSGLYREKNGNTHVGTGTLKTDNVFDTKGSLIIPGESRFLTILSDFGTDQLLGFLEVDEQGDRARLHFTPSILSDSIIKLQVRPEVSSLDYTNAVLFSGFRIPALRIRRVSSTVGIRRDQSVILSGLFNEERERVRTGVPLLMNIPIIGSLFGSSRWQNSESELLVVVTRRIIDPANVEGQLVLPIKSDTALTAREAIQKRLPTLQATQRP